MENNWPETLDELLDECQRLISKYDLYTLGKYGKPFTGETEPRVDGTEYLAGEYQYGVAMIPAQWVTYVLSNAELGSGTCELTETDSYSNANEVVQVLECSACGETCEHVNGSYPRCPYCGRKVVSA